MNIAAKSAFLLIHVVYFRSKVGYIVGAFYANISAKLVILNGILTFLDPRNET